MAHALGQREHADEARAVAVVDRCRYDAWPVRRPACRRRRTVGLQRCEGPQDAELIVEHDEPKRLGQDLVAGPRSQVDANTFYCLCRRPQPALTQPSGGTHSRSASRPPRSQAARPRSRPSARRAERRHESSEAVCTEASQGAALTSASWTRVGARRSASWRV